jgi:hypothetical protein
MEVTGTLELSGIERLVIDQKDVWLREITRTNQIVWKKEHTEKRKPHAKIVESIKGYVKSGRHHVWVHLNTVNVEHIPTDRATVHITGSSGPFMFSTPRERRVVFFDEASKLQDGMFIEVQKNNLTGENVITVR